MLAWDICLWTVLRLANRLVPTGQVIQITGHLKGHSRVRTAEKQKAPERNQRLFRDSWPELLAYCLRAIWASLVAQTVRNLPTTEETWVRSLGREDPLEKGMATRSSVLAWRIPQTEEPEGLQSVGCKELGMAEWPTLEEQYGPVERASSPESCIPAFMIWLGHLVIA